MAYTPKTWTLEDPITDTDLNRIEAGIDDVDDRLAAIEDDTGVVTTGITASSGWSIASQDYRRIGKFVSINVRVTRTGAAITIPAGGDPTNVAIVTLPVGIRPTTRQALASGYTGQVASYYVETDGIVYLAAALTTVNGAMSFGGMYLLP